MAQQAPQSVTRLRTAPFQPLYQESDLVVAIFRTALIILAVLASLLSGAAQTAGTDFQISVVGAVLYNFVLIVLYWRRIQFRWQRQIVLVLDILLVTAWVYLTWTSGPGAFGSPLYAFYYVIIIISALWFSVPGALSTAVLITVLYLAVVYLAGGHDTFLMLEALYREIIYLYLVAIVAGYLVDTHKREREQWTRSQVLLAQYQERFRAAQEVYEMLIPSQAPQVPGLEIAARWRPAVQEGGGDFYDVIPMGEGCVALAIADVAGKSMRGSLKLPLFKAAFIATAQVWNDPGDILAQVNRIVYPVLQPDMFITACIIIIDREQGMLRYANAGQDAPVFVRPGTGEAIHLETGGLVLGIDQLATYPTEEQHLLPGDTICLYSDGITEARNAAGAEFGTEDLEARVQAAVGINLPAEQIADNIFEAVNQFSQGSTHRDDMTLVVVRVGATDFGPSASV